MKHFGTDGIRGIVGEKINTSLIRKVANGIVHSFNKFKWDRRLLIGNDTRISSDWILSILSTVLLSHDIEIDYVGSISSPALAFLTREYNYPLSLMLSASHNDSQFNGLKFFNNLGEKVSTEFEEEFEKSMDRRLQKNTKFAHLKFVENYKWRYINFLKSFYSSTLPCVIDCANGGTSEIAKQIFKNVKFINNSPNGLNINENSGCTHLDVLQSTCIREQKIGFAFDGDGDRLHIVTKMGKVITGDKILFLLSKFYQDNGDTLVGTIYTNGGLDLSLNKQNIHLIRANVGDKNVYKKMQDINSSLGGEDSGHIILKKHSNTGDGMLNAIIIANILSATKQDIDSLLTGYVEYHQEKANLHLSDKDIESLQLDEIISKFDTLDSRIIIRKSGTEPVLRVFVESKDKLISKEILLQIIGEINCRLKH